MSSPTIHPLQAAEVRELLHMIAVNVPLKFDMEPTTAGAVVDVHDEGGYIGTRTVITPITQWTTHSRYEPIKGCTLTLETDEDGSRSHVVLTDSQHNVLATFDAYGD